MSFLIKIFVIWFTIIFSSLANEVKVFDFTEIELSKLKVKPDRIIV